MMRQEEATAAKKIQVGRSSEGMAGLAKGLMIIESFGTYHSPLTVSQAAQLASISRASARRCLLTLVDLGYLLRTGSQFRPTPRMLRLSAAYYETASLPQLAQMHLDAARDELQESISLAVLEGQDSVFVARAECERIVSSVARLGRRLPAFASATGRILLAALPEDQLEEFLATIDPRPFTCHTIVNKDVLRERIRIARDTAVEVTDEEIEEGMVSMAVPVQDLEGRTVAAMSMSASSARISAKRMKDQFSPILAKYAKAVNNML